LKTNEPEEKAKRDLPELNRFCRLLLTFATSFTKPGFEYNEADHFGFMALCFLEKQKYHMRSLIELVEKKQVKDAEVISRIMLEGMCMLIWAGNNADSLPLKWRAFSWVEDYRLMLRNEKSGEPTDPNQKDLILSRLSEIGHLHISRKHQKKRRKGNPLTSDIYTRYWYGDETNIRKIFENVVANKKLYDQVYGDASKWVHWNPRGLGLALKREGRVTKFSPDSYSAGATALAGGFHALSETLKVFDFHFELGKSEELDQIEKDYISRLSRVDL